METKLKHSQNHTFSCLKFVESLSLRRPPSDEETKGEETEPRGLQLQYLIVDESL